MKSEWSAAPIATLLSVVPRDVSVSARASSRGDMRHAENCGHAMRARSGVGWQGGNWLLISRVNLFVPDGIYPVWRPGAGIISVSPGGMKACMAELRGLEVSRARNERA